MNARAVFVPWLQAKADATCMRPFAIVVEGMRRYFDDFAGDKVFDSNAQAVGHRIGPERAVSIAARRFAHRIAGLRRLGQLPAWRAVAVGVRKQTHLVEACAL